ncbi:Gfo/Idh/MocA family protein [Kribbella solani]|uniref:Gfo/Idh/MocA family protein n=1 Tax=Kribbella solani TaxID=236067 RepID=UPI0029BA3D7B|nr:Gfo/Idh/MocA family oxidoreductase [Kribbella solani]MDX2968887.1 Gfo/Idh/MocA family oxidoreductase [Kribbella solani]
MSVVRWAILGTAQIASGEFIPSLWEVGGGRVHLIAARDGQRAKDFAAEYGIDRYAAGYQQAVDDPDIDAIYIPLPNTLHAEWTIAALRAGKAVLCEKPFATSLAEAQTVTSVAERTGGYAWEAFAFLYHPQTRRVLELVEQGTIGAIREVHGIYHSPNDDTGTIRNDPTLAGGALLDVGVYPLRLARLLLGSDFSVVRASQQLTSSGLDLASSAEVDFAGGARLFFEASFSTEYAPAARIVGELGELRVSGPYATDPEDKLEILVTGQEPRVERLGSNRPLFSDQLDHIHAVLAGTAAPRHQLAGDAAGTLALVDAIRRTAATSGKGTP